MTWVVRTVSRPRFYATHFLFQLSGFLLLFPALSYALDWAVREAAPTRAWYDALIIGVVISTVSTFTLATRSRRATAPGVERVPTARQRVELQFRGDLELAKRIVNCVLQHLGSGVLRLDKGTASRFSAHSSQGQRIVVTVVEQSENEARVTLVSRPRLWMGVVDGTRGVAHMTSIVESLASAQQA